ncbi:hypothetical protein BDV23DRAFT_156877 [Aspergillus alliaceus]|uniref:Uncharacterized protein n=1 Tax=Petromyces alliaceus TaxID=209559 RepID=A0A5N7C6A6_PETAA|nr:hypothetical protein BDV23DRAFT_156877 [Aspergillus alliaceus]
MGFFPPAAAAAGTAAVLGNGLIRHFSKVHIQWHKDLLQAAVGYVRSMELDDDYLDDMNMLGRIADACLPPV